MFHYFFVYTRYICWNIYFCICLPRLLHGLVCRVYYSGNYIQNRIFWYIYLVCTTRIIGNDKRLWGKMLKFAYILVIILPYKHEKSQSLMIIIQILLLSLHYYGNFCVSLQQLSGTWPFESKLSLRSFA